MRNNILPIVRQFVALPFVLLIGCVDDVPMPAEPGSQWLAFASDNSDCDTTSDVSVEIVT